MDQRLVAAVRHLLPHRDPILEASPIEALPVVDETPTAVDDRPAMRDELWRLREELEARDEELRRLQDIDAAIHASRDVGTILQSVLDGVVGFVLRSQAVVFLADPDDPGTLRLARCSATAERPLAAVGALVDRAPATWRLVVSAGSLAECALRGGGPVITHDFGRALAGSVGSHRARALAPDIERILAFRSCVAVPLAIEGEALGLLVLGSRGALTQADVERVGAFATQAAIALSRLRHERRLDEQRAALEHAYEELRTSRERAIALERMGAVGEMTSGLAHNFNNALTAVLGNAQLALKEPELPDAVRHRLELIARTAEDAARLVQRLRALVKDERLELAPVELNLMVQEAAAMTEHRWRHDAESAGAPIALSIDPQASGLVMADAAAIKEVLVNLVHNAVNAMPYGGSLRLRTYNEPGRVCVAVRDTGIGMTPEVRRHCFEPFFTTGGDAGTGLGLSVAYGVLQRHQGDITVESAPGEGSEFVFWLPLAAVQCAAPAPAPRPIPIRPLTNLHVLIVDDQVAVRETIGDMLATLGHRITLAADGREALALFDPAVHTLVLTDLSMPGLSGLDLARAIKARSPHTPVLLMTGYDGGREDDVVTEIDVRLRKPVALDDLQSALGAVAGG
jgi:signal transduction histidine kinase